MSGRSRPAIPFDMSECLDYSNRDEILTGSLLQERTDWIEVIGLAFSALDSVWIGVQRVRTARIVSFVSRVCFLGHGLLGYASDWTLCLDWIDRSRTGYVCIFIAWAFYLKGISVAISALEEVPLGYEKFLSETGIRVGGHSTTKHGEQIHQSMVTAALRQESGLFDMLNNFLASSPLFVTTIAWKTGSTITEHKQDCAE